MGWWENSGGLQDGNAVVAERLDLLGPAADGEAARVAPRVVVEGKEIASLVGSTAVHVLSHLKSVGVDVCGRVSHRDLTISTRSDVLSHVTSDSLDVRSSGGGGIIIDDLVSREESQSIGVLGKGIDGCEDVLEIDRVVGCMRSSSVQRVLGGVDVEDEVNTRCLESAHTGVMVGGVVDRVDTDGVDTQLLELGDVPGAAGLIGNGVCEVRAATGLVVDATNVETVVSLEESWWELAGAPNSGDTGTTDHCP